MLVGRDSQIAVLHKVLEAAIEERGSGLLIRGEPGIGKSALLGHAVDIAADFRVLRAVGVEAESQFAFAALHQLLLPVLDRVDRLPSQQAEALRTVFGMGRAEGVQPFLVAAAALTLLSDLAGERPVLCVVDDAHWCDQPSLSTFAFLGRRLEVEPIVLLLAVRDGEGCGIDAAGMTELRLAGLDEDAAAQLLDGRIDPMTRGRLVRSTGGNPLALLELPQPLGGPGLAADEAQRQPLPLTQRLEQAFLERVRPLGPYAQTMLLLAAAEGAGRLESIVLAAPHLGADPAELGRLQAEGLLELRDGVVVFRHPLVRSAVYQAASAAEQRAAHRALARALDGDQAQADRRAWHLAKATSGTDEAVAAELERSAEQAQRRSGHLAVAAALHRAAELSPADDDRARRLAHAAKASWVGGDTVAALRWLHEARALRSSRPDVRLEIQLLLGTIELRVGEPDEALAVLAPAALAAADVDPRLALHLVVVAREAAFTAADTAVVPDLARVVANLPEFDDPVDRLMAQALGGVIRGPHLDHDAAAAAASQFGRRAVLAEPAEPELLLVGAGMAWAVGEVELATRMRTRAAALARSVGAAGTLALTLEYLVPEEIERGHYANATALASEGYRLARETSRHNSAVLHLAFLSQLEGLRGREAEAKRLAEEALAEAIARRLLKVANVALRGLGLLALAARQAESALIAYRKLDGSGPEPGSPIMAVNSVPDHIEAAVRAGVTDGTGPLVERYLDWVGAVDSVHLRAMAERTLALLAESSTDAEDHYLEALRLHAGTDSVFEHARTELLYGEFLRREKQRSRARVHLRSAMDTFDRLGTPVWSDRARQELRATGETARKRAPNTVDQLTPQEVQIAHAVSDGATNREVAAQLFVSPRTVDYHLRKVYRKLGITSRRELMLHNLTGEHSTADPAGEVGDQPIAWGN